MFGCGVKGSVCCFWFSGVGTIALLILSLALSQSDSEVGAVKAEKGAAKTCIIAAGIYAVLMAACAANWYYEAKVRKRGSDGPKESRAEKLMSWD